MNTQNQNNIAAPSVTIAPRNPARGVLTFVVTLTTHKDVRSYPCRSLESAIKLAERFIAGVIKPRPAAQTEPTPPPAAEPVAAQATPPRRPSGILFARALQSVLESPPAPEFAAAPLPARPPRPKTAKSEKMQFQGLKPRRFRV